MLRVVRAVGSAWLGGLGSLADGARWAGKRGGTSNHGSGGLGRRCEFLPTPICPFVSLVQRVELSNVPH